MSKFPSYNVARLHKRLQMGSRHTMGDVADLLQVYGPQLDEYREQLFDLYSKKADLLAKREAALFKYKTNWFTRLKTALRNFSDSVYSLSDSNAALAAERSLGWFMFSYFPMITMDGKPTSLQVLNSSANLPQLGLSSVVVNGQWVSGGPLSSNDFIFNFKGDDGKLVLDSQPQWFSRNYYDSVIEQFFSDSLAGMNPYTQFGEIVKYMLNQMSLGPVAERGPLAAKISEAYSAAGVPQILKEGKDLFKDLMNLTFQATNNWRLIQETEAEIIEFLKSYQLLDAGTTNLVVSDILKELQEISKLKQAQEVQALINTPAPVQTVTPATTTPATTQTAVPSETKKPLNKGLLLLLAAGGAFLATRE